MFLHRKELIQSVNVGTPDARFGTYLLEQFGGATGELTAALQYWVQSFHVENAGIRDMLQDIAIEEFSHLEMVGNPSRNIRASLTKPPCTTLRCSNSRAVARTSSTAKEAVGQQPTSKKAAMLSAIYERISRPKLAPGRPTSR